MSTTKHAGFIVPGYSTADSWTSAAGTATPAAIQAIGGNWCVLQTSYYMANQFATSVTSGPATRSDAELTAMMAAATSAGLKICLKPHVVSATGTPSQTHLLAGGQYSDSGNFTQGLSTVYIPDCSFDSSWVGAKLMNPNYGYYNDANLPTGLNANGTQAATFRTIMSVTDSTHIVMSGSAAATTTHGSVAVANDSLAAAWFASYQSVLDHLMSVCTAAGTVDMLDIQTEHNYMTLLYPQQWRNLISYLRTTYPTVKLTMSMAASVDFYACTFWDALDYIGLTWYRSLQAAAASGETYASIESNWDTYLPALSALSAAWGSKQILFTELGYRSIVGAGYQPDQTGQSVTADQQSQRACVQSFFHRVWNQPWFAGFHWWSWSHPLATPNPTNEVSSYAVDGKLAQHVFEQVLAGANGQFVTSGGSDYRR